MLLHWVSRWAAAWLELVAGGALGGCRPGAACPTSAGRRPASRRVLHMLGVQLLGVRAHCDEHTTPARLASISRRARCSWTAARVEDSRLLPSRAPQ
jgi:hypothetical protein